jgi:hypothetical protein
LTPAALDAFYPFYLGTVDRRWGNAYLTRRFFTLLGERLADRVVLVVVRKGKEMVGAALNLLSGDTLYGRRYSGKLAALASLADALGRQALHATRLDFNHPITGAPLRFTTGPPADLLALLAALRVLPAR